MIFAKFWIYMIQQLACMRGDVSGKLYCYCSVCPSICLSAHSPWYLKNCKRYQHKLKAKLLRRSIRAFRGNQQSSIYLYKVYMDIPKIFNRQPGIFCYPVQLLGNSSCQTPGKVCHHCVCHVNRKRLQIWSWLILYMVVAFCHSKQIDHWYWNDLLH